MRHYNNPIFYVRPEAGILRRLVGEVHYRSMTFFVSDDHDILMLADTVTDQIRAGKADLVRYEATARRLLEVRL